MAGSMSTVFSGENINEINEAILDYVETLKEKALESTGETAPAKKAATKTKAKARAKKKAAAAPETDDLDDLLPDEENGGDNDFGAEDPPLETDDGDDFGDDDLLPDEENGNVSAATKEDVRDILGELSRMGNGQEETAQKILKVKGGVEEFGKLKKDKFQIVYDTTVRIIEKIKSVR